MYAYLALVCTIVGALEIRQQIHHGHLRGVDPENPGELTGALLDSYLDEYPTTERYNASQSAACRRNETGNASEHRRTVVVARYDEDVSWLQCLPQDVAAVVYQSKDPTSPRFVENVGNEASKYLSYIVDNYDDLPDTVMFMQAGRQDWHDPEPKDVLLQKWIWGNAKNHGGLAFLPTNAPCIVEDTVQLPAHDNVKSEPLVAEALQDDCPDVIEHTPRQMETVREVWDEVFSQELGPLPQRWITHCCAQFEVSREAIQQHSVAFYERLLSWTMRHDRDLLATGKGNHMRRNHDPLRQDAGHVLEVTWALIFSDPMSRVTFPDIPHS